MYQPSHTPTAKLADDVRSSMEFLVRLRRSYDGALAFRLREAADAASVSGKKGRFGVGSAPDRFEDVRFTSASSN